MTDFDAIFKAYDIRGVVGEQIDATACTAIGKAFAQYISASADGVSQADGTSQAGGASQADATSQIVIGYDMRPEGASFADAFTEGVTSLGVNVLNIGLCATEMLYFASGLFNAPGAMFTASHNPACYNGIKLCGAQATPIGSDTSNVHHGLAQIKKIAQATATTVSTDTAAQPGTSTQPGTVSQPNVTTQLGTTTHYDILDDYIAHVLSFVDVSAMRPLKVVVDAGNGMAGMTVPAVFEHLPFELEIIYQELDGTFPNHPPNPIQPENLSDLQSCVAATSADVGFAFDGDADRVFVVDETAKPVSSSTIIALISQETLTRKPGSVVAHNLICSASVPKTIIKHGGKPARSRVGHTFMKQVMAETGAVFGGEHSGHYYFQDNYNADNAIIPTLMILEILSRNKNSTNVTGLTSLTSPFERYFASGEINFTVDNVDTVISKVAEVFSANEQDRLDGLTVHCGDWWFNLRPSNTEPLLRLNLEASTLDDLNIHVNTLKQVISSTAKPSTARP